MRWLSSVSWGVLVTERFVVVHVSGVGGSSQRGMGSVSGVNQDCSTSKWECIVSRIVWEWAVISLHCGTLMVAKLG